MGLIGRLDRFPAPDANDRVRVTDYLAAAKDCLRFFDAFGYLFSPLKAEIAGDVDKAERNFRLWTEQTRSGSGNASAEGRSQDVASLLIHPRAPHAPSRSLQNLAKPYKSEALRAL